jgi:hypothetical protein
MRQNFTPISTHKFSNFHNLTAERKNTKKWEKVELNYCCLTPLLTFIVKENLHDSCKIILSDEDVIFNKILNMKSEKSY